MTTPPYNPGGPISPAAPTSVGPHETITPPPKRKSRLPWILGSAATVVFLLVLTVVVTLAASSDGTGGKATGGAANAWQAEQQKPELKFRAAQRACDPAGDSYSVIADGGKTFVIKTQGAEDTDGFDSTGLRCVLDQLAVPASVREHIGDTRALDGQQTDTWDAFTARWTYHPDDGLSMTVQVK